MVSFMNSSLPHCFPFCRIKEPWPLKQNKVGDRLLGLQPLLFPLQLSSSQNIVSGHLSLIGNRNNNKGKENTSLLDPECWLMWSWPVDLRLLFRDLKSKGLAVESRQQSTLEGALPYTGLVLGGQAQLETFSGFKGGSRRQCHELDRDGATIYCITGLAVVRQH